MRKRALHSAITLDRNDSSVCNGDLGKAACVDLLRGRCSIIKWLAKCSSNEMGLSWENSRINDYVQSQDPRESSDSTRLLCQPG